MYIFSHIHIHMYGYIYLKTTHMVVEIDKLKIYEDTDRFES
jgi:hypothetical protein